MGLRASSLVSLPPPGRDGTQAGRGGGQRHESSFLDTQDLMGSRGWKGSLWLQGPASRVGPRPASGCLSSCLVRRWNRGPRRGLCSPWVAEARPVQGRTVAAAGGLGRGGFGRKSKVTALSRLARSHPGACRWEAVDTSTSSHTQHAEGSVSARCCSRLRPRAAGGPGGHWCCRAASCCSRPPPVASPEACSSVPV